MAVVGWRQMKTTLIALLALVLCLPVAGADKKKPGTVLWEFRTGSGVTSSPAIGSDGTVYVGSQDKKLYAINGKSGVTHLDQHRSLRRYKQPFKLSVVGGKANPAAPKPGEIVTVSASTDKFFYWRTDSKLIDIALPSVRSFKFAMPSSEVTIIAQEK